ncbi:MAG TPA: hypothetical protein VIV62_06705 [Chthoniobacterales bacterium]
MQSSTLDRAGFEPELAATDRPLRDFALWLGILGPPLLWLTQFQTVYMLVFPACGQHRNVIIIVASLLFGLVIAVCGFIGWSNRVPVADSPPRVKKTRHFMAVLSILSMSIFVIVTIAEVIAALMIDACVT